MRGSAAEGAGRAGARSGVRPEAAGHRPRWGTSERRAARPEAPRPPVRLMRLHRGRVCSSGGSTAARDSARAPRRRSLCRRHRFSPFPVGGEAMFSFRGFLQPTSPSGGSPGVPVTRTQLCWGNLRVYRTLQVVGARCCPGGATGLPTVLRPWPGVHLGERDLQRPRGCPRHNRVLERRGRRATSVLSCCFSSPGPLVEPSLV